MTRLPQELQGFRHASGLRPTYDVTLTPELARRLLDDPDRPTNRSYEDEYTAYLGKQLTTGKYRPDLRTMLLEITSGHLLDGQHICAAVAATGISTPVRVMLVTAEDMRAVDIGKDRKLKWQLIIDGYDHDEARDWSQVVNSFAYFHTGRHQKVRLNDFEVAVQNIGREHLRAVAGRKIPLDAKVAMLYLRPLNPEKVDLLIDDGIVTNAPPTGLMETVNRIKGWNANLPQYYANKSEQIRIRQRCYLHAGLRELQSHKKYGKNFTLPHQKPTVYAFCDRDLQASYNKALELREAAGLPAIILTPADVLAQQA